METIAKLLAGMEHCGVEGCETCGATVKDGLTVEPGGREPCPKCERFGDDCGEHLPTWEALVEYWKTRAIKAESLLRARGEA